MTISLDQVNPGWLGPAPRRRRASCSSTEHSARVRPGARHQPPATSRTLAPDFRKDEPRLRRYRRRTNSWLPRIDQAAVQRESPPARQVADPPPEQACTPDDLAAADKQLTAVEAGWRDAHGSERRRRMSGAEVTVFARDPRAGPASEQRSNRRELIDRVIRR
jgi:hypothetical protein